MKDIGFPTPDVPSRGYQLWIVGTVMVSVAGLFVTFRLVSRYFRGGIRIDDWMLMASLICSVAFTATLNEAVEIGLGKHTSDLSDEAKVAILKMVFATQVIYKVVICLIKVSILQLYLRIFYVHRVFRWLCFVLIAITVLGSAAFIPPTIWQCRPITAFWDRSIPHKCVSSQASWLSYAVINIVTDFLILVLPIQQILRLQLKKTDKIALILVFLLGGFVCITSILRATYLAASSGITDVTWALIPVTVWSTIEINTGIICACTPIIRQPLAFLFPRLFSTIERSRPKPHTGIYTGNSRTRTVVTNGSQPWTRSHHDHQFTVTVGKDGEDRRPESQEGMIDMYPLDPRGGGIMKTMDVSISESRKSIYESPHDERGPL